MQQDGRDRRETRAGAAGPPADAAADGRAAAGRTGRVPQIPRDIAGRLAAAGLDPAEVTAAVVRALGEDLAGGADVTTAATVPADARGRAELVARSAGVVAGLPVAELAFWLVSARFPGSAADPAVVVARAADGDRVEAGQTVLTVTGRIAPILTAERTVLNLLGHLSGVATLTRQFADAVAGTGAVIRDTRKTLPGLRALQKYAVRCGGGANHRMSLSDAALIKDNHVAAAGSVGAAYAAVAQRAAGLPVEVECDTLEQVADAIEAGAGLILLDNFDVGAMREAVALTAGRARLEASGRITLASARAIAETGVDYLAIGALTHSAPVLDIGLDLSAAPPAAPPPRNEQE
jgi:nicotinate-nucleotide pyrophosphorylase (carboxylating)